MTDIKPPTPQAISALLRKAGFEKSARRRVGRVHESSEGYRVTAGNEAGVVLVLHGRGFAFGAEIMVRRTEAFGRYAEAMHAAGYETETRSDCLIVTVPSGTEEDSR